MKSPCRIIRLSPPEREAIHFYYDVCPESPDGRRVVYFQFDGAVPGPGEVVVADRDGGKARPIFRVQDAADRHSAIRQQWVDDDTVACCPGVEGRLRTTLVSLRDGLHRDVPGAARMISPVAPLALTTRHDFEELPSMRDDAVCLMDLRRGEVRPLFTVADALKVHPLGPDFPGSDRVMFLHTKWSPGGRRFFVIAANIYRVAKEESAERVNSIFVAEADGSGLRYLCEEYHHPVWGADDDHVLSFRPSSSGGGLGMTWWGGYQELVSAPVNGGAPQTVISGLAGKHLALSPDGRRVVADATHWPSSESATIFIFDTGAPRPKAVVEMTQKDFSQRGCHVHPAWSRDGRRIYFNSMESGRRGLYAVDLD